MSRRLEVFLTRFLALFLALSFTLPNSAFALRPAGLEESNEKNKQDFVARLTDVPVPAGNQGLFPRGSDSAIAVAPLPAAGLEEKWFSEFEVPLERQRYFDELISGMDWDQVGVRAEDDDVVILERPESFSLARLYPPRRILLDQPPRWLLMEDQEGRQYGRFAYRTEGEVQYNDAYCVDLPPGTWSEDAVWDILYPPGTPEGDRVRQAEDSRQREEEALFEGLAKLEVMMRAPVVNSLVQISLLRSSEGGLRILSDSIVPEAEAQEDVLKTLAGLAMVFQPAAGLEEKEHIKIMRRLRDVRMQAPSESSVSIVLDGLRDRRSVVKRSAAATIRHWVRGSERRMLVPWAHPLVLTIIEGYAAPGSPMIVRDACFGILTEMLRLEEFHEALADLVPTLERYRGGPGTQRAQMMLTYFHEADVFKTAALSRLTAELGGITPLVTPTLVGIGPTQARKQGNVLEILAPRMMPGVRQQMFVLTEDETQAKRLSKAGVYATTRPLEAVLRLLDQFTSGVTVRVEYHAPASEMSELAEVIRQAKLSGRFRLVVQPDEAGLRAFLQRLLANLMEIPFEQVPDRVHMDQLVEDVELLLKA